jgi:hypothetical protein
MSTVRTLAPAHAHAGFVGFIDAITDGRVFGWAWDKEAPEARIEVTIRLGDRVLGTVHADRPREDLLAGGVGDGAHAFEFELPAGVDPSEIRVFGRHPMTGTSLPVRPRPANEAGGSAGLELARIGESVQAIGSSMRVLHRTMQAVLTSVRTADPDRAGSAEENDGENVTLADIASQQAALRSQVQSIELALGRIDETLQRQAAATRQAQGKGPDRASLVPLIVVGLFSLLSLIVTLVHAIG